MVFNSGQYRLLNAVVIISYINRMKSKWYVILSQIVFAARPVQQIRIIYQERPTDEEQLIFTQSYDIDVISYWKWHQYTIA